MTDRRKVKRLAKILLYALVGAVIGGYSLYRAQAIASGPDIAVSFPANGALLGESLVEIKGTAKNISFLNLNGAKIFTDEAGAFSEKILLSYGYNVITLEAEDRFGRTTEETLQVIYK